MKISTKGRYGLRAMLDLAVNSVGNHVSLKSIAERQCISESYLEQVFSTLRKANIVSSVKGAQGGYFLEKKPVDISIGEILRALEGNLSVVDNKTDTEGDHETFEGCIRSIVWNALDNSIDEIVNNITLEDLVMEYKRVNSNESYMFYI